MRQGRPVEGSQWKSTTVRKILSGRAAGRVRRTVGKSFAVMTNCQCSDVRDKIVTSRVDSVGQAGQFVVFLMAIP